MTRIIRPLGDQEYTYWIMDLAARTQFTAMAEITGGDVLARGSLEHALAKVRLRHPLLRVKITMDERGKAVFAESDLPVHVHVVISKALGHDSDKTLEQAVFLF